MSVSDAMPFRRTTASVIVSMTHHGAALEHFAAAVGDVGRQRRMEIRSRQRCSGDIHRTHKRPDRRFGFALAVS
jgi:hypothetical protein